MGRLPKLRAHYVSDAQYLMRLAHAIEMDDDRPEEWRKMTIDKIQSVASDLLKAPPKEGKQKKAG